MPEYVTCLDKNPSKPIRAMTCELTIDEASCDNRFINTFLWYWIYCEEEFYYEGAKGNQYLIKFDRLLSKLKH